VSNSDQFGRSGIPCIRGGGDSADGFTLLEIIVALTILGLIAAALMPGTSDVLRLATRAAGEREAVLLAESKLAELSVGRLEPGSHSGVEPGSLSWRTEIESLAASPSLARFAATVTVQPARGTPVRLATILLGPLP
jgi:type II secretion system protein I